MVMFEKIRLMLGLNVKKFIIDLLVNP